MGPPPSETVKGKVASVDKSVKKIKIEGKEYELSDDVLSVEIKVGDEVEADVANDVVKTLKKLESSKP